MYQPLLILSRPFTNFVDVWLGHIGRITINAFNYLPVHNPVSEMRRMHLKHTVLRSGPVYQRPDATIQLDKRSRFTGWRVGALLSCIVLIFCLVVQCAFLITISASNQNHQRGYKHVMYKGSCTVTKHWITFISLLINFVATLTISSSNYVMQCLSSPSESELRHAHRKGRSLQLGVSSPSNIVYISYRKTILWWLMGLSSIHVHLLLNSAFFSSLQTNNYGIVAVTSDYDDASLWTNCNQNNSNYERTNNYPWVTLACSITKEADTYRKLDNSECIEQYSSQLLTKRSNLVLVSNTSSVDRSELAIHRSGLTFCRGNFF